MAEKLKTPNMCFVNPIESGETTINKETLVRYLIGGIEEEYATRDNKSSRNKGVNYFFDVVRGGNVDVVRSVMNRLNMDKRDVLTWLLGRRKSNEYQPGISVPRLIMHFLMFLLCSLFVMVTTPIFYMLHTIMHSAAKGLAKDLAENFQLKIMYAVLSDNRDMVKIFREYGCLITDKDDYGNNIFHYIAAISVEQPDVAIRCHQFVCTTFDSNADVKHAFMEDRNNSRMSPFEQLAKYGSLTYLEFAIEKDPHLGTLLIHVDVDNINLNNRRGTTMRFSSATSIGSTNDLTYMAERTKSALGNGELLVPGHVIKRKLEQVERPTNSTESRVLDIWSLDLSQYAQGDALGKNSYILQLLTGHQVEKLPNSDVQFLFTSKLLKDWISTKSGSIIVLTVITKFFTLFITLVILADIILHGGDRNTRPNERLLVDNLLDNFSSEFIEPMKTNESFSEYLRYKLNLIEAGISQECKSASARDAVTAQTNDLRRSLQDYLNDSTVDFYMDIHLGLDDPLGVLLLLMLALEALMDLHFRLSFLFTNYNWKSPSILGGVTPFIKRYVPGSYVDKQLTALIYSLFGIIAILWRTSENKLYTTPSYPANNATEIRLWINQSMYEFQRVVHESLDTEESISSLYVICLLLSMCRTVHMLRLVPAINSFIITTKKMAKHLLEFALVFTVVFVVFSAVFLMIMKNQKCPVEQMYEFRSMKAAVFWMYSTILGHEIPDYTQSDNSVITYFISTVFMVLIMLNLIIAVMTMTATEVRIRPLKMVMCRMELWEELLGNEARWLMIKTSVMRMRNCLIGRPVIKRTFALRVVKFN